MSSVFHKQLAAMAWLCLTASASHAATVQVLSATVKDQRIAGATVILQKNGEASADTQSDSSGVAQLTPGYADDAHTLVILKKEGYSNLVVKCPCDGLTYAMSPVMRNLDGMRIVLTWGATPNDLDSHISYPGNHIYFLKATGTSARLDVDDTSSYGPETITLDRKREGETYVYSVHDFSHLDQPSNTALSNSDAKVFIYVGKSLVRTYYVPRGKPGNLWTVFRITGDGEFQDINNIRGTHAGPVYIDGENASYADQAARVTTENAGTSDPAGARAANHSGEEAYHAGRLDQAIALFQESTQLDPSYGQSFGNLGLAYQKAGRSAEAIWADRKAIALASGSNAPATRAGAHYNIGRMYEAAGQLDDALGAYQAAKREKANPVYDKAIKRVAVGH